MNNVKKAAALLLALALTGCAQTPASVDEACVAATTYPVWQFTCAVTEGTGLRVERVISEPSPAFMIMHFPLSR